MSKKLIIILSFLLVAVIAAGVYAAFYKNVGVTLTVNEVLSDTKQNFTLLAFPGEIKTENWPITNNGATPINIRLSFVTHSQECLRDPTNLSCVLTYTPLVTNINGDPLSHNLPYEFPLLPASNTMDIGIAVASGSEIGTMNGAFLVERI